MGTTQHGLRGRIFGAYTIKSSRIFECQKSCLVANHLIYLHRQAAAKKPAIAGLKLSVGFMSVHRDYLCTDMLIEKPEHFVVLVYPV